MGRPTRYTEELAEEICRRVSNGETLAEICRDAHIPPRGTIVQWDADNREGFANRYARAKQWQLEHWADEVITVADDGTNDWVERNDPENPGYQLNGEHIQRSRLRTDSRKWMLAKLMPSRYGDRVSHEHGSDPERPVLSVVKIIGVKPGPTSE